MQSSFLFNYFNAFVLTYNTPQLKSTSRCTSTLSSATRMTSAAKHPSGEHYKLEVMACTLQSPHLCLPLPAITLRCTLHFLSHWKKKRVTAL